MFWSRSAVVVKRGSSSQSGRSERAGQRRPFLVGHDGRRHEPVLRLVDQVDEARRRALRDLLADVGLRAHVGGPQERQHRVQHGEAHMLAPAGLEPPHQRRGDRLRRRHRGELVGQDGADEARALPIGAGLHRGQAGEGLHDRVVHGLVGVRSLLAEAVDRHVDDVGRHLADRRLVDAETLDHAGPKVLHQHIGASAQALDEIDALRRLEIDGDRALVAVEVQERGRKAVAPIAVGARVVALARLLDLDDVGALVGEDHGRPRPRQHRGQIDDANACERSLGMLVAGALHVDARASIPSVTPQYKPNGTMSNL